MYEFNIHDVCMHMSLSIDIYGSYKKDRSLLHKSPVKETIFCKRDVCMHISFSIYIYEVATISRFLKNVGLLYRISSLLWGSFAKKTYNLKEPANHSHAIPHSLHSRHTKKTGLFCTKALSKRQYSAKETYIFKEPTNHSHPIPHILHLRYTQKIGCVRIHVMLY